MSTMVLSKCWPLVMPPTAKSVLISLADNANDEGDCWPSIATIAMRTCFSERAVQGAIKWLETEGALSADRTNGRHTRYKINLGYAGPESRECHYVYKITHLPSGQFYVGLRTSQRSPENDDYWGSGASAPWLAQERELCEREVIGTYPSREEAAIAESAIIRASIASALCLNRKATSLGNDGGNPRRNCGAGTAGAAGASLPPQQVRQPPQEIRQPPQQVPSNRKEPSRTIKSNQVALIAIETFNASQLVRANGGLLGPVNPAVGMELRAKQVEKCIKTALAIREEMDGAGELDAPFWETYWSACYADEHKSGRKGGGPNHPNWLPNFEYLTRAKTMLEVYERAAA